MLALAAALAAALLYAVGSVLQHRAAQAPATDRPSRFGLIGALVRRPLWVVGLAADAGGFVLQFTALAAGTIVVVQPLQVLGLLFALPLSARVFGHRMRLADYGAASAVCAGLILFLVVADPAPGRWPIGTGTWAVTLAATCGTGLALALLGYRAHHRLRPVLLAASAGVLYGVTAGLTKATGQLLAHGGSHVLLHWQPYVLVAVGGAGVLVAQSAFRAGHLDLSLPTMTVVDPVVSVVVGALAFRETIAGGPGATTAEVVGLVLTAAGVVELARSPAIRATRE